MIVSEERFSNEFANWQAVCNENSFASTCATRSSLRENQARISILYFMNTPQKSPFTTTVIVFLLRTLSYVSTKSAAIEKSGKFPFSNISLQPTRARE